MAEHTPGPWRAVRNNAYWEIRAQHFSPNGDGQVGDACASSCNDHDGRSEELGRANAELMAAAPCAIDALAQMLDAFGGYSCPAVDAAITVMQRVGCDRWSMQAQMEAAGISPREETAEETT